MIIYCITCFSGSGNNYMWPTYYSNNISMNWLPSIGLRCLTAWQQQNELKVLIQWSKAGAGDIAYHTNFILIIKENFICSPFAKLRWIIIELLFFANAKTLNFHKRYSNRLRLPKCTFQIYQNKHNKYCWFTIIFVLIGEHK